MRPLPMGHPPPLMGVLCTVVDFTATMEGRVMAVPVIVRLVLMDIAVLMSTVSGSVVCIMSMF